MSLQKEITLILLVVITLFAALDHAVQRFIVFPTYREIDRLNVESEMKRSMVALDREVQHLDHLALDWAAREDLSGILGAGRLRPGKAAQLENELSLSRLDFCYLLDRNGRVVWGSLPGGNEYPLEEAAILGAAGLDGKGGEEGSSLELQNTAGLLNCDLGVVMIAAHEVKGNIGSGEFIGTCLVGKLLNKERLQGLVRQTGVLLEFMGCDCIPPHDHLLGKCRNHGCALERSGDFPAAELAGVGALGPEPSVLVREQGGDRLQCLAYYPDVFGRRTLLLKAVLPMPITAMGRDVLNGALLALITAGLLIVIVLREAIKMSVLKPISLLTGHAVSLRSSESHASHISSVLHSQNELGELAREFDSMVERLATARRQLVEQSYYSGMTEVASRVMHSLRNALTPITAHLDLLREEFRDLPVEQMKMAGRELSGGEVTPERREMLARYLRESMDYLSGVMADAGNRLKGMDDAVAAIEKILAEQEKFTGRDQRSEPVKLIDLVQEAGTLLSLNYYSGLELLIDSSLAGAPLVNGRRHALLHIFANLISNAIESILRTERADGRIEISAATDETVYPGMVHVTVSDNGSGIAREDMDRIFERGYTTKATDSTGIGLHWCANTIAAMHGRLHAESSGLGGGAVMHLFIPCSAAQHKESSLK